MSFVNEKHGLILDLIMGKVAEEEALRRLGTTKSAVGDVVTEMLDRARIERDPVGVEFGLYLGHHFGFSTSHLRCLEALADAPWHQRHEAVVDALARLRSPTSVGALYNAAIASHPYRDYDEAYSLGTKSIWALGAIGTKEAIERLRDLLECDNEVLRGEAASQLRRLGCQT